MNSTQKKFKIKVETSKTINSLQKHISSLKKMQENLMKTAKDAKLKGISASYSLAKSGIKNVYYQVKKAEEMAMNLEILKQHYDFASCTRDFTKSMSLISKELGKTIGSIKFADVEKNFVKAMSSNEIFKEQLDGFLGTSRSIYEGAIVSDEFDKEIDALIEAEIGSEVLEFNAKLNDANKIREAMIPSANQKIANNQPFEKERTDKFNTVKPKEKLDLNAIIDEKLNKLKGTEPPNSLKEKDSPIRGSGLTNLKGAANRPVSFNDFIGQEEIVGKLKLAISTAKARGDVVEHILFSGGAGLGKTTLANIIASEMGTNYVELYGPNLTAQSLTNTIRDIKRGDIIFVDELHNVARSEQDQLFQVLEDFKFSYSEGSGRNESIKKIEIPKFTFVGATTMSGKLQKPFLDRLALKYTLQPYEIKHLGEIIVNYFNKLGYSISEAASIELAKRTRGIPRVAVGFCKRIRDLAQSKGEKEIVQERIDSFFDDEGIDGKGLTKIDINLLKIIINDNGGGPVGITTLASKLGVDRLTVETEIEPYLLFLGLLDISPSGRMATQSAYEYLGYNPSKNESVEENEND